MGRRWPAALLLLGLALLPLAGSAGEALWCEVRIEGEWVWVDVSFAVPASRAEVWEVLTDFEHMARFVSNLTVSKVVGREGAVLHVMQSGKAHRGVLEFPFETLREIHLSPMRRIESHLISGSMKHQEGVTELGDEGGETRVVFHGASVPGVWIPPVVGKPFIEAEIREQFEELEAEILRRRAARAPRGRRRNRNPQAAGRVGKNLTGTAAACCSTEGLILPSTCISQRLQSKRRVRRSLPCTSVMGSGRMPFTSLGHRLKL